MIKSLRILLERSAPGAGDIAMIIRGAELLRTEYPLATIGIKSRYPDLVKDHPVFDVVFDNDWNEYTRGGLINQSSVSGETGRETPASYSWDIKVLFDVILDNSLPKHQQFCDQIAFSLEQAGYNGIRWDGKPQTLWVTPELKRDTYTEINELSGDKIPIGIFGRSAQSFKNWDGFPDLLRLLIASGRYSVFYFDAEFPSGIYGVHEVIGKPLDHVVAMVSSLKLIVGNDSAGLHFAGGVKTPCIGIFGPTDPKMLIGPYYDASWFEVKCPNHPCWFARMCFTQPCLREITPEMVYSAINGKLNKPENIVSLLPTKPLRRDTKKILIARFVGLGDVLMTWFGLDVLKAANPEADICYLTNPTSATLFAGQDDLVDRVIPIDFKHHALPEPVKLPINYSKWNAVYNLVNRVDFGSIVYKQPRADNFAELMNVALSEKPFVRKLVVTDEERAWFIRTFGVKDDSIVFAFQCDSNGVYRHWFIERFQSLAWNIYKAYGGRAIIICVGNKAFPRMKLPEGGYNLTGQTNIRQFITILVLARIILASDSSGLHIGARAEDATVIGLFGSTGITDTGEWAHTNYYDNVVHIKSDMHCSPCWDGQLTNCRKRLRCPLCLWRIKPKMVMGAINNILKGGVANAGI